MPGEEWRARAPGSTQQQQQHPVEDGAGVQETIYTMEGLEQEDGINLETVTSMQTQQAWQVDGVRYCPDMSNIVLPSYFPVIYKPGYRGGGGRVEQIQLKKQQYQVVRMVPDVQIHT